MQDRLLRPQASHHPGQEQVQDPQVPLRRPRHQQGHHSARSSPPTSPTTSCLAAAYAHELPRYGIKFGLTNYAAAYATGLLLARRINKKFNLEYEGNTEVNGEDYNVEAADEGAKPFRCSAGRRPRPHHLRSSRVFGALKGATDGGLDVPHNDHRFPGSKRDGSEWTTSPETHRKYIFGQHVAEYMKQLEDNDEALQSQFGRYVKAAIKPDDIESIYTKAHAAIRADPTKARDGKEKGRFGKREKALTGKETHEHKRYNATKQSLEDRKAKIVKKVQAAKAGGGEEEDEE